MYGIVVQRMVMKNELGRLIAEQAADMAGTHGVLGDRRYRSQSPKTAGRGKFEQAETTRLSWCERHRGDHQDRERLAEGAELTARREAHLRRYPFRTRRERRIYELHAAGMPAIGIAKRMHRAKLAIQVVIWRVERSIYADAQVFTFPALRVWQYWLLGWAPGSIAQRCGVSTEDVEQVVREAIREWRRAAPSPAELLPLCSAAWRANLGNLTPAAVLKAGQRNPDIAEMLTNLGLA